MTNDVLSRRLAVIVAADVVGYSRLMEADESGTLAQLKSIRKELIDPKISEHRGRLVKTTGDGLLMEFFSVTDGVHGAIEIQEAMAERNAAVPADRRLPVPHRHQSRRDHHRGRGHLRHRGECRGAA